MSPKVRTIILSALVVGVLAALIARHEKPVPPAVSQGLPTLVDLGAEWCGPCRMQAPILEELRMDLDGKLSVVYIDVDKDPKARSYGVRAIPTQVFYDAKGKELERHTGLISKEGILQTFRKHGIEL
ncbi:MAG: thioredoxin family protein [Armatimonadota bacterium]